MNNYHMRQYVRQEYDFLIVKFPHNEEKIIVLLAYKYGTTEEDVMDILTT